MINCLFALGKCSHQTNFIFTHIIVLVLQNSLSNLVSSKFSSNFQLNLRVTSHFISKGKTQCSSVWDKTCFFLTYKYNPYTKSRYTSGYQSSTMKTSIFKPSLHKMNQVQLKEMQNFKPEPATILFFGLWVRLGQTNRLLGKRGPLDRPRYIHWIHYHVLL